MKMTYNFVLFLLFAVTVATAFTGEDKFLKKYAMMKIYESCFGEDVVRQIRKEMKQACAKCAYLETPQFQPQPQQQHQPLQPEPKPHQDEMPQPQPNHGYQPQQNNVDVDKLHQAILAFRPNPLPQPPFRPYNNLAPSAFYAPPFNNPGYQITPPGYFGYSQVPFSPYSSLSMFGQPVYNHRLSRQMDLNRQMELLTSKLSGRVKNVTCVMQELGYLDDNLEPNFSRIQERIANLPINEDLKKDMQEGVAFCQQFSQCVPDVKKDNSPLSRELARPMFFFKCYKHKKLEACIMKDAREKFSGVSDEELEGDLEFRRTGKATKMPLEDKDKEIDEMAVSMYEFLYSSDSNWEMDEFF